MYGNLGLMYVINTVIMRYKMFGGHFNGFRMVNDVMALDYKGILEKAKDVGVEAVSLSLIPSGT